MTVVHWGSVLFLVHPNVKMVMDTVKKFTLVIVTIPTECYAKPPYKDWTVTWSGMASFLCWDGSLFTGASPDLLLTKCEPPFNVPWFKFFLYLTFNFKDLRSITSKLNYLHSIFPLIPKHKKLIKHYTMTYGGVEVQLHYSSSQPGIVPLVPKVKVQLPSHNYIL
jgi:hypothetical protein